MDESTEATVAVPKPLTPKQEAFCRAVTKGLSYSDAYRLVFKPKKSSDKTIHENSSRLAHSTKVAARLAELQKAAAVKAIASREECLEVATRIIRADPRKMFDAHGNCREVCDLDENEAAAVVGFEQSEEFEGKGESRKAVGFTKRMRLADRLRAIEVLAKLCGYNEPDKSQLVGADGLPLSIQLEFVKPATVVNP